MDYFELQHVLPGLPLIVLEHEGAEDYFLHHIIEHDFGASVVCRYLKRPNQTRPVVFVYDTFVASDEHRLTLVTLDEILE